MGLGNDEDVVVDDTDGGGCGGASGGKSCGGLVSCSICLEVVTDNGIRSWAKLQCGHQFHLDCIGSAFNVKGAMQCPNCRKMEKGQWLFANGSRSFPEFSMEEWTHDEDLYDLSYSEMSFGVQWCPFGSLARLPSSFEVEGYIVGSIAASVKYHPGTIEVTSEYSIWNRGNGTIRSWIYSSVSSEVSSYLTGTKTAHDLW